MSYSEGQDTFTPVILYEYQRTRKSDQNNAVNEDLKDIQEMVDVVKRDGEVSLQHMKSFEHDQLMYEEGRLAEIENTEREISLYVKMVS